MTITRHNLGRALSAFVRFQAREDFLHADVELFGAPSECHALVAKGEARRRRLARKAAEAIGQAPMRVLIRLAAKRGGRRWNTEAVARYYARHFPF